MAVQLLGVLRGDLLGLFGRLVPDLLLGLLLLPGPLGLGVLLAGDRVRRGNRNINSPGHTRDMMKSVKSGIRQVGYKYRDLIRLRIWITMRKCLQENLGSSHPYPENHLYVATPSDSLRFEGEGDILVDHETGGHEAGGHEA